MAEVAAMGKTSALAARWHGGTVTMGPLGCDRRVRARTGKRRTPGQRDEDSEVEEVPSGTAAPS